MSLRHIFLFAPALAIAMLYVHEYHPSSLIGFTTLLPGGHMLMSFIHELLIKITKPNSVQTSSTKEKTFTIEELSKFNGNVGSPGLYLSILGKVYDVEKGKKHYGPDGSYHAFAGCDASRSFITGDFNAEGISDDVIDLSLQDIKSLFEWSQFYHDTYTYKGKLVGRFYTATGDSTEYHRKLRKLLRQAKEDDKAVHAEKVKYPPCNAEWSAEFGSKVWCTKRSGGIERDWVGVPRKLYEPGSDSPRCACVQRTPHNSDPSTERIGKFEIYKGCNVDSDTCYLKE